MREKFLAGLRRGLGGETGDVPGMEAKMGLVFGERGKELEKLLDVLEG